MNLLMEGAVKRGLSASWLKYFACLFMLIDHLAYVWNPFAAAVAQSVSAPLWSSTMHYLGRLAFPIFVFFLAEGCRRTHHWKRYLLRLGIFALLAQAPFTLLFQNWGGNVIVTFFLGALGVFCYQKLRGHVPAPVAALPAAALAVLSRLLGCDYDWFGVALVLALYLCGESRRRQLICLAVGLAVLYLVDHPMSYMLAYWVAPGADFFSALPHILVPYFKMHLPYHLVVLGSSLLALIPLSLYDRRRGRGSKWFFYIFYPAHMLILYIIARCLV